MAASDKFLFHSNTNYLDIGQCQPHTEDADSDVIPFYAHFCNPGATATGADSGPGKIYARRTLTHYHYQAKGF